MNECLDDARRCPEPRHHAGQGDQERSARTLHRLMDPLYGVAQCPRRMQQHSRMLDPIPRMLDERV